MQSPLKNPNEGKLGHFQVHFLSRIRESFYNTIIGHLYLLGDRERFFFKALGCR